MRLADPDNRRRRTPVVAAAVLAAAGLALVSVALTRQQPAPASSAAAAALPVTSPTPSPIPPAPSRPPAVLPPSEPLLLTIPSIRVRSSLLRLGQNADGTLEVPAPPHYDRAGWYRYSPTPGALGPAVIAGHVDSARGGPSVFFRLGELRKGDEVSVRRADGTVAVFAVDDVRRFPKSAFPTDLVYGNTDHAALRLITCGGPFDRSTGHYLDNVVVTASLLGRAGSTAAG
jgi:hypothetical protein